MNGNTGYTRDMIKTDNIETQQAVQQAFRIAAEVHDDLVRQKPSVSQLMIDLHISERDKYLHLVDTVEVVGYEQVEKPTRVAAKLRRCNDTYEWGSFG
jgi:hypothetical protein